MRLIDRQAVIDALWNAQRGLQMMDSERADKTIHGIQIALHTIEQMPTVDPVRHGQWIDITESHIGTCSLCGDRWGSVDMMNYCPSCGAKMDEVEREDN